MSERFAAVPYMTWGRSVPASPVPGQWCVRDCDNNGRTGTGSHIVAASMWEGGWHPWPLGRPLSEREQKPRGKASAVAFAAHLNETVAAGRLAPDDVARDGYDYAAAQAAFADECMDKAVRWQREECGEFWGKWVARHLEAVAGRVCRCWVCDAGRVPGGTPGEVPPGWRVVYVGGGWRLADPSGRVGGPMDRRGLQVGGAA